MSEHWKRAILAERIVEVNSVTFVMPGNDYCNFGSPDCATEQLINDAIRLLSADELEQAERTIEQAERVQIDGIRRCGARVIPTESEWRETVKTVMYP